MDSYFDYLANVQTPRFFNLGPVDLNIQDAPKVDGLVSTCSNSSLDSVNVTEYYSIECTLVHIFCFNMNTFI